MEWIGAGVLATIAFAMLGTLFWVSRNQDEHAGRWWIAAGTVMAVNAVVTLVGQPAFLFPLASEHAAAPLSGWLLYRGACEYTGRRPQAWVAGIAVFSIFGWFAARALARPDLMFDAAAVGTTIPVLVSIARLFQVARTPLGRLLAISMSVPIGLILVHPWFHAVDSSPALEIRIWLAALSAICLLASCVILERRMAESNHALRQTAEQLRLGTLISGMGTWTVDPGTGAVEWSEEMYRIYGMTPDMPVPTGRDQLALLAEEDREPFLRAIEAVHENGFELDHEFRLDLPGGKPRYARSRAQFIRTPEGRPILIGTTVDITDHRQALEELRRHRHHLEELVAQRTAELAASQQRLLHSQRLASIGTLTAGLAHQVNNPVGSILAAAGFAKRCRNEADELEILRYAVDDIEREAKRCGDIVHDMLRFASDRPTDKKCIPIDPLLERICVSLRRREPETGSTISFSARGPGPVVEASAIELEQAVANLIENAIQSSDKGVRVMIERSTVGDEVQIRVRDDGPGIPPEHLAHVLDPFYTSRLDAGGTGLGLSVAHGIAREHGGSLRLESTPGEGTTALLSLVAVGRATPAEPAQHGRTEPGW